jgi:hypothetical protein
MAGITKTEGSITYDVYTHGYANTNAKAALWIQQGISVNDLPPCANGFTRYFGKISI